MPDRRFIIQEYLKHEWTHELVGFPWEGNDAPEVIGPHGKRETTQLSGRKVWFDVAHVPPLGRLEFTCRPAAHANQPHAPCASARLDGDVMILSNGQISVKVPAPRQCEPEVVVTPEARPETAATTLQTAATTLPAPILGVQKNGGPWIGAGTLTLSPDVTVRHIEFGTVEEGPLWCTYAVTYRADAGADYRIEYRLRAGQSFVEIFEHSRLCHDAHWDLDIYPGLDPKRGADGHRTGGSTRIRDLQFGGTMHIGDLQAPDQNMHFFADDFDIFSFAGEHDAVGLCALYDGDWTYIPENPISMLPLPGPKLVLRARCKAGARKWAILLTTAHEVVNEDFYATPTARLRRKLETTLDWVKDLVLEWEDIPADQRPHAICGNEDVERARTLFKTFEPLRQYGEFIDREAELVQGQFDAGGHYPLNDEHREDPMCAWLVQPDPKIAEKLKRGLIEGLRIRVDAVLGPRGHRADIVTSINLGRTVRPFMHIYDILAPHLRFTREEERYFKASAAFLAYKMDDPHYWNAEAIVLHSDHPKSSHRTAWFPNRESDWCTYNVDTAPHNFHIDVYTAFGSVALTFPTHPRAKAWLNRSLSYLERELDNWIFKDGAFIESACYTLATMLWWVPFLAALKHAKVRDYFLDSRFQRMCWGLLYAQGPFDRRIQRHSFTVMGDAMYPSGAGNVLAWCARLGREDANLSQFLMGAWDRAGRQLNNPGQQGLSFYDALFIDPSLPSRPMKDLVSQHLDGLGLILRHAHGTPDEVYFFLKCGKIYSHFHYDEGSFFAFADQVPIMDEYGVQYGSGTDECGNVIPGHSPRCHNAISFSSHPQDRECYNRGFVTRFVARPYADYAVCEMPIHLLYIKPGMSLWGFKGEEAPFGWWRRHVLFVKPHGFFFYDEIESEFTAALDLNFKADRFVTVGELSRVYKGRYGTDVPVCVNFPRDGAVYDGRVVMQANPSSFPKFSTMEKVPKEMKETFYNQVSMHVSAEAHRDFSWAFAWAKPHEEARLAPLGPDVPGSVLTMKSREIHALVGPWLKAPVEYADGAFVYSGWAGAMARDESQERQFIQLAGNLIGEPGGLTIEGEGPFRATLGHKDVVLETTGAARWLTLRGMRFKRLLCDEEPMRFETLGPDCVRIAIPKAPHTIRCERL